MSGITIIVLEVVAPVVILIVYGRIKIARAKRKGTDGDPLVVPDFEPKPEAVPGFFLSYFSVPQRAYLRQQIALGRAFYYIVAYLFVVVFTSGLLPSSVDRYGPEQPLAQRVWYSYLEHITLGELALDAMMVMAAMIAVYALTTGAQAVFNRTRPLTHRFLFWARILSAIATILASLATALAVSFVLLLLFYGPVWLHLLDTLAPGTVLSHRQEMHLIQSLQTSVPRLFLSLATMALLIFSAGVLLLILGSWFPNKRTGRGMAVIFGLAGGIAFVHFVHVVRGPLALLLSRVFFLYMDLGPPPRYGYVLVPVLASTVLLFIAQRLIRRVEL